VVSTKYLLYLHVIKKLNIMATRKTLKLHDFMGEIRTYAWIEDADMERAKNSNITSANNKNLKDLIDSWINQDYDECPELLADELVRLIK
jgi:capsid portal protein